LNRLVQSNLYGEEQQNKYWKNGFFIEQEVEENAGKIRRAILNIHNGTVEDIVRRLQSDESCSKIHLSSQLVDALLYKFGEDWKSALGFFRWANLQSDHKPTTYSCDKMVDILGKMKQIDRMWEIVKWMGKGGLVTMETVAKIMRRLAGAGRWKDAIEVFNDLKSWGLDQNTESMNLLLDTLCKEKKADVAREIYLNLKGQISPNANTFNIFVHGWCNARRIDEAMWTIQEMKDFGFNPSVITYSTIIKAYCKKFKFSRVYDLLDEMVANGCSPNVVTYTIIMHSLAKSRKFEEAISIVEKMRMSGCKPDTHFYNSLINILGLAGQVGEASHIFGVEMQMNGVSRNLSTYNTMISVFCSHDRQDDALGVLKEMEDFSCKPVLHTYIPLLKLCFKTGNLDDQLRMLLGEIVNKHHLSLDLDTYTLLIHGLCNVGEIEWACQLFDDMISREILPKDRTFGLLMCEAEQRNMDGVVEKIKCLMKQLDKFPKTEFS
ncbi:pentatricopeptide repeat-containing protein At3g04130, mitochondrial-like, partial [Asparagus officinalis]|uniref:pentatricopeptide repeat-containing protein At3g04130, mitochondrial-like n=1 Tax=Asparagus officinalis TaxID=4686 RepID=UPI00098DF1E1